MVLQVLAGKMVAKKAVKIVNAEKEVATLRTQLKERDRRIAQLEKEIARLKRKG